MYPIMHVPHSTPYDSKQEEVSQPIFRSSDTVPPPEGEQHVAEEYLNHRSRKRDSNGSNRWEVSQSTNLRGLILLI